MPLVDELWHFYRLLYNPKKNTEKIKVGNDEVGVFEIERKGYLSVAENLLSKTSHRGLMVFLL